MKKDKFDFQIYKEIFVEPREKILDDLHEKEKQYSNLFNKGAAKEYDKILEIFDEEKEKQKEELAKFNKKAISSSINFNLNAKDSFNSFLKESNSKQVLTFNKKSDNKASFFDQQIQVQPPDLPNATIASPLTPGNGWAPSIPLTMKSITNASKSSIKDLLVRAKAGMQAGDVQKEAHLSFFLGIVSEQQKQYNEAIKYYRKFFNCAKIMEDKIGMSLGANRIGMNYFYIEKYDKSLEFHLQNIKLSDSENLFSGFYNLGIAYRKLEKYDLAFQAFYKTLEFAQQKEELESECLAQGQIGMTFLQTNAISDAFSYLSMCYNLSKKLNNFQLQLDCLMLLIKINANEFKNDIPNAVNVIKDAYTCAKTVNDNDTANMCLCNMGVLDGSQKFFEFKETFQKEINDFDP